jgi:uncharacterized protein YeaO (DUF488 family)
MITQIKRVYEHPAPADGCRVLVDRLWPRGISKDRAAVDEWLRDVAPSAPLRRWFGHEPARWAEFKRRYFRELAAASTAVAIARLRTLVARRRVTLLFAAQDEVHNNAAALREYLARPRERKRTAVRTAGSTG